MKNSFYSSILVVLAILFVLLITNREALSQLDSNVIMYGAGDLQSLAAGTYYYNWVTSSFGMWGDGSGTWANQWRVTNVDIDNWSSFTWYFNFPPGNYSQIRAWDDSGPLSYSTSISGSRIDVTINFRNIIQPGQSYHLFLYITIGNMASHSGSNWRAYWTVSPGAFAQSFLAALAIPSNSSFQSISPTPTAQWPHDLDWEYNNYSSTMTIDVYYSSSSTVNVPLIQQTNPAWSNSNYGNLPNTSGNSIGHFGSYMIGGLVIVGSSVPIGQKLNVSDFQPNPSDFNLWLKNNLGYDAGSLIVQSALPRYAQENGRSLYFRGFVSGRDDAVLDFYLSSGYPVILGVNPLTDSLGRTYPVHYVLATGKTTVDGTQTYSINDPIYGTTTLYDQWNNNYYSMTLFSTIPADRRTLRISAHSPVELLITDPSGRKSGYDPTAVKFWNEIPGATYFIDAIAADADPSHGLLEAKVLLINVPTDGDYKLSVWGTGPGIYEINSFASDWNGKLSRQKFSGTAQDGSLSTKTITYSSYMGVTQVLFLPLILK